MSEYAGLKASLRLRDSELGNKAADAIEALERQVGILLAVAAEDAEECDRYHRERDVAVADNAALLRGLTLPESLLFPDKHPGAALLARMERLEAVVAKVVAVGHDDDCMFCGFKDRIALDAAENANLT